jgi:Zn-dependent peptidase ImmA (M78 family)
MGVRGRRLVNEVDEPTLLGDIDDIIKNAKRDGFIDENIVNIKAIVEQNGIQIREEELPSSKSGYLAKIDGQWVIGVNKSHGLRRKRFTIAHEFAHYCLHKSDKNYFVDTIFFRDDNVTSIEYTANAFAAKLLMPDNLVKHAISNGVVSLRELADLFDVSLLALKNRIAGLGYKVQDDEE